MSSSDSDFELDLPYVGVEDINVQPYMYEPILSELTLENKTDSSSSSPPPDEDSTGESNSEKEDISHRIDNSDWCSCRNSCGDSVCSPMQTPKECICCREFEIMNDIMETHEKKCITEVHGFCVNCLDPDVLKVSFFDYTCECGPIGEEEPVHELYRYIAYRRFVRWVWGILGKKNRNILPSCVVSMIRKTWPAQDQIYSGFKYPEAP